MPNGVPSEIPEPPAGAYIGLPKGSTRRRRRRRDTFVERTEPLVLLASVDPEGRGTLREGLERNGFQVAEAPDGFTAVGLMGRLRPDVVLLDAHSESLDPLATCEMMRTALRGECTPVVVLLDAVDVETIGRTSESDVTTFAVRPVDHFLLAHQIRCALRQAVAHEHVRRSEERFRQMVDRLDQVFLVTSDDGAEIIYVSRAYEALTGRSCRSLLEQPDSYVAAIHPDDRAAAAAGRQEARRAEAVMEYRIVRADGQERWVHEQRYPISHPSGGIYRVASLLEDVTERRRTEAQIRHLAEFDSVTALPNRSRFRRALERALARAGHEQRLVSVLFLDLDHFKRINDTFGHQGGDEILLGVAERLRRCVRATDAVARGHHEPEGVEVARLGGDEFTVLLDDLDDLGDVATVARRMLAALREPFPIDGQQVQVTCSIGAAVYPRDGADADALLKCADAAMYAVKEAGRDGFRLFGTAETAPTEREALAARLRAAVDRRDLRIHYQPWFDTAAGAVVGFEALIRWPDGALLVPPKEFIPVAEETGLIIRLGDWVLRTACEQATAWAQAGLLPARIAVNLSAPELRHPELATRVSAILHESRLPAERLELEIAERTFQDESDDVLEVLRSLRRLGVSLTADHFGTCGTSADQLRRLPISAVKIDRSLVREVPRSKHGCARVRSVIATAEELGLAVAAEGVERPEQLAFLQREGCYGIQGFLLGRPLAANDVYALLGSPRPSTDPSRTPLAP